MWAEYMGWTVPLLHVRICIWLDECDEPERVLMVFRGAAKSTIYAIYKAFKLYSQKNIRSLVWSADGPTAEMLTADVINIISKHPLCRGMLNNRKPGRKKFWVNGAQDARNPSMRAAGVDGNVTGARADDVDFDDVEVPGNIETPEARKKLRDRISESTHIAVPGAQKTYIGTPHHHDSIYPERIAAGAAVLKIPLFEHMVRYTDTAKRVRFPFDFPIAEDGLYVMAGIHKTARMLREGVDYQVVGKTVVFDMPPGATIDIASGCAWPERFTRKDIEQRRKETRTLNAWDSQYMLEAKPITEVRLDPEKVIPYEVEPIFKMMNRVLTMWLGNIRIVSATVRLDPSSGKINSDISSLSVFFQDDVGRQYWHRCIALTGEVAEFDGRGMVVGGQVWTVCDVVEEFNLPSVRVETNGIGGNVPAILRGAFKARGITAAVVGEHESANKNLRILEAFEAMLSSGMIWAHTSAIEEFYVQMRDWNPAVKNQIDDHLDTGSKCLQDAPVRIGKIIGKQTASRREDWRPSGGVYEAATDY